MKVQCGDDFLEVVAHTGFDEQAYVLVCSGSNLKTRAGFPKNYYVSKIPLEMWHEMLRKCPELLPPECRQKQEPTAANKKKQQLDTLLINGMITLAEAVYVLLPRGGPLLDSRWDRLRLATLLDELKARQES